MVLIGLTLASCWLMCASRLFQMSFFIVIFMSFRSTFCSNSTMDLASITICSREGCSASQFSQNESSSSVGAKHQSMKRLLAAKSSAVKLEYLLIDIFSCFIIGVGMGGNIPIGGDFDECGQCSGADFAWGSHCPDGGSAGGSGRI